MDNIVGFISNQWVVGIASGIISGILVYFITSYIFERKKSREHSSKIAVANSAVLDILRPHIANSGLPNDNTLDAIINSVSRHYAIPKSEMNKMEMFYEDLIYELIGNLYIPNDVKMQNIEKLLINIQSSKLRQNSNKEPNKDSLPEKITMNKLSIFLGVLTSIVSILSGVIGSKQGGVNAGIVMTLIGILLVVISSIIGLMNIIKYNGKRKHFKNSKNSIASSYYVDTAFLKMRNHGPDLVTLYNEPMKFVDYFAREEELNEV